MISPSRVQLPALATRAHRSLLPPAEEEVDMLMRQAALAWNGQNNK
jgi:hypothetical protein